MIVFFLNCCFFSKYYFVIFFSTYFLNAKIRCTLFACVWRPTFWSVAAALQMCGELREIAKYIYLNLLHVQIFVVILSLFSSRRLWCAVLAKRFKVKWMKWIFIFPDLLKNYLHSLLWLLLWRIISSSVNAIFFAVIHFITEEIQLHHSGSGASVLEDWCPLIVDKSLDLLLSLLCVLSSQQTLDYQNNM